MSNFDFLKNINNELYEIGNKLEEDVINSPRAVTADATQFLETLVKDIYRQSNNKLESNLISFYKKIDNLYRMGVITYIYKNKLQDAYNLRNKIHNKHLDPKEESQLAYDIHQRLYYISKKYYRDFTSKDKNINIPEYQKPENKDVHFDNCIICGEENKKSSSNMCNECNRKIENANLLLSLQNTLTDDKFTRKELMESGISEIESISLLRDLTQDNIIMKKAGHYTFNDENFKEYITQIDQYIEIGLLVTKFYNDEITIDEIKNSKEYWIGSKNQKPCHEFYKLVNRKLEKTFEKDLLQSENIKKSIKNTSTDYFIIKDWFLTEKEAFIEKGSLNDSFILFNELLIRNFFNLKKKGLKDSEILKNLEIPKGVYNFWKKDFMGEDFFKKTSAIKKDLIIKEIRKNKTLTEALKYSGVSRKEFNKLYILSKNNDGEFYRSFEKEYTAKRQKVVLKQLRFNNLNVAIRKSKITKIEFLKWYYKSETEESEFYMQATEIFMNKYLKYRKNGWNKKDILKHINISKDLYNSWSKHENLKLYQDFKKQNNQITSTLVKKGLIINALKKDKGKEESIFQAGLTPREFLEIYNASKKERTNFHKRFDMEYENNRKRLFAKLIRTNDFFNTIEKCEISQIDFNKWYLKDQDKYLSEYKPTDFYQITTTELMNKYLKARWDGKNKPDASRSIGLSNMIIDKWLSNPEYNLYHDFKKRHDKLTLDMVVRGFNEGKCKIEVAQDYDIPISAIEKFITLGRGGYVKYGELCRLYDEKILPLQLEKFLNEFKTKTFKKSLKNTKLTKKDLDYPYDKDEKFHEKYLNLKIDLYVDNILAKKSEKISLKNSNLTGEEFEENREYIEEKILKGRINIIGNEMLKYKTTGLKLANKIGVSIDELYEWYFKGINGDKKYKEFALMLEFGMILPRQAAYSSALDMGIPKNWLIKQVKKDLGAADYNIWEKHNLLDVDEFNTYNLVDENISEDKLKSLIDEAQMAISFNKDEQPEFYRFMKKVLLASQKHSQSAMELSKSNVKVTKKVVMGK